MKAYKDTDVHWTRSQSLIVKMLNDRGIYEMRFTNLKDKFALEFSVLDESISKKPVAVRIVVPLIMFGDNEKAREKDLNRLHRVLFYHLKAKFVAIESGLTEFMEEFMPHLVIMDREGNSTTVGQKLLPQYKQNLESGEQKEFKLLPGN